MITDGQKNTPAPWVPFTRAGCDVGGVGIANLELENNTTDVTNVYGAGSTEANETRPTLKTTDFVGIAVHCSKASTSVCNRNTHAKTDSLPDEPGGYNGYKALFGAKYVDPAIVAATTPIPTTACRTPRRPPASRAAGTSPTSTATAASRASTGWRPTSLGYVEQMQESGVPVTYAYISDVHDSTRSPELVRLRRRARPPGPGTRSTSSSSRSTTRRSETSSRTSPRTGSTRATRSSWSPWTRAITSPAAPVCRTLQPADPRLLEDEPVHDARHVPDEPDRRGRHEHRGRASVRRAGLRHPLRRRPGVLRQRPARARRSERPKPRA